MERKNKKGSARDHFRPIGENRKGQQEIAGFVLIVVLVVVALMVFLVISLKKPAVEANSKKADDLLSSLMSYTTECIVSEPSYENVQDLIKSCYENRMCKNFKQNSCEYLNQTLSDITKGLLSTSGDNSITSYEITAYLEDAEGQRVQDIFMPIRAGKCNQTSSAVLGGGPQLISTDSGNIKVFLKICTEIFK